MLEDQEI